jgi:hypothetical protein
VEKFCVFWLDKSLFSDYIRIASIRIFSFVEKEPAMKRPFFTLLIVLLPSFAVSQQPNLDSLKQQKGERFSANFDNFSYPTIGYGTFRTLGREQFSRADRKALPTFYSMVGLWVGAKTPEGRVLVSTGDGDYQSGSRSEFHPVEWPIREEIKQDLLFASLRENIRYSFDDQLEFDGHAPLGIQVEQRSHVFEKRPFFVLDLEVKNVGSYQNLRDMYVGLFADIDVPDGASEIANNDVVRILGDAKQAIYFTNATGPVKPVIGFVFLSHVPTTLGVWNSKNDPADDAERYRRLSIGTKALPTNPDDYRALFAVGPFDLRKGEKTRFSIAFLQTGDEEKFKTAVQEALSFFNQFLSLAGGFASVRLSAPEVQLNTEKVIEHSPDFRLEANYPNPFNPSTEIRYELPSPLQVRLIVYDLLGREVKRLVDATQEAGTHGITWDGKNTTGENVGSGTYLMKLDAGNLTATKKLILVR